MINNTAALEFVGALYGYFGLVMESRVNSEYSSTLSKFGRRFCADSGTFTLMDDLGKALTVNPDMLFLGGGNPARIPAVEAEIKALFEQVLAEPDGIAQLCGNYQSPQGDPEFLDLLAAYLNRTQGWDISAANIALSNGSQAAFFVLFNMFAGEFDGAPSKQILLPMAPEYIGYASSGLTEDMFCSMKPNIELLDDQLFKYHVDFEHCPLADDKASAGLGAVCLSRPANPTGNMISDLELAQLKGMAAERGIPLIIDAAYGQPFPGIVFTDANSHWDEDIIYLLSLSKLGMPGVRTGIIIAKEEVIQAYSRANTALNLACSSTGPILAKQWFKNHRIDYVSQQLVRPYYQQASQLAMELVAQACVDLPVKIHAPQGAFFLWLWCQDLPVSSQELYESLKSRGVLVLSGHHFFIGLEDSAWQHSHQCLRITYCAPQPVLKRAIGILADELKRIYRV